MSPKHWLASATILFASVLQALPEGELPFDISNRIRIEWDDNIRLGSENEEDSVKFIEDLELLTNLEMGNTLIGLRYSPSFTYWTDRDEDETDLHHQFDASLFQAFNERLSLTLKETFRFAELPELIDEGQGVTLRENNDYIFNSIAGELAGKISETSSASLTASHFLLNYDEDDVAAARDYDKIVVGGDLGHQIAESLSGAVQARYHDVAYENANRDTDSVLVGGLLRNVFSPALSGTVRAGWERKSFERSAAGETDAPYGSAQVNYQLGATRVNGGLSFGLAEAGLETFSSQERLTWFAGVSRDLTGRMSLALEGFFAQSSYEADEADPTAGAVADGDEDFLRLSSKLSYMITARNFVELAYQLSDLDSDFTAGARNYTRNRVSVGWRTQF